MFAIVQYYGAFNVDGQNLISCTKSSKKKGNRFDSCEIDFSVPSAVYNGVFYRLSETIGLIDDDTQRPYSIPLSLYSLPLGYSLNEFYDIMD